MYRACYERFRTARGVHEMKYFVLKHLWLCWFNKKRPGLEWLFEWFVEITHLNAVGSGDRL